MSQFVHFMIYCSYAFLYLNLIYNIFSAGFHLKSISVLGLYRPTFVSLGLVYRPTFQKFSALNSLLVPHCKYFRTSRVPIMQREMNCLLQKMCLPVKFYNFFIFEHFKTFWNEIFRRFTHCSYCYIGEIFNFFNFNV